MNTLRQTLRIALAITILAVASEQCFAQVAGPRLPNLYLPDLNLNPAEAQDWDIVKCAPIIDNNNNYYFGLGNGIFRATDGYRWPWDTTIWEFQTGGPILSSPAVDSDGILYFGSSDGNLYALYPNGVLKWKFATGGAVVSSPALAEDGSIFVGSKDGKLYAVDPDGRLNWTYQTGDAVYASPALATDGTIYIGSLDGSMYALSPGGELQWSYATEGPIYSSVAVSYDNELIFGSTDFNLYTLEPDGTLKWKFESGGMIIGTPAIDHDGSIVFGADDGISYRVHSGGFVLWTKDMGTPIWSSQVIDAQDIIRSYTSGAYRLLASDYAQTDWPLSMFYLHSDGSYAAYGSHALYYGGDMYTGTSYTSGYTGTSTVAPNDSSVLTVFDYVETSSTLNAGVGPWDINARFGTSPWPKFRHDARNTGNVATSLEVPEIDVDMKIEFAASDINRNGTSGLDDFQYMLKMVLAGEKDPAWDMDGNGTIDVRDAVELMLSIFKKKRADSSTLLASDATETAKLDRLTAEQQQALSDALDSMELTAQEREIIQTALNAVGGPVKLPKAFALAQNSPNPFNPSTTIAYDVPESASGSVKLAVFDIRGRLVKTLLDGKAEPGSHSVFWDGTDESGKQLSSGVYFYRLRAESYRATRKMVLVK